MSMDWHQVACVFVHNDKAGVNLARAAQKTTGEYRPRDTGWGENSRLIGRKWPLAAAGDRLAA